VDPISHPGLSFVTFRAGEEPERMAGWYEAQQRGFHQGRTSDEMRQHYGEHLAADGAVLRGVWQDAPALGTGAIPVATYAAFDKTMNTGRGLLPVRMISDITVSPTHRRRGLLRAMITEDLRDAVEGSLPLAALTVSEGTIYGRFGFGPAVFDQTLTVDTGPAFALRALDDDGSVELLEPAEAWPAVEAVFARFHEQSRGSLERPRFYETILTGAFDYENGPDKQLRTAVHLDAAGTPDGYVAYRPGPRKDRSRTINVADLVALTPAAHRRLWRFLADLDLSDFVEWRHAAVDDPLAWALVDPFAARVTGRADALWVRVLDVVRALEARPWGADGELVVEVDDPLGHAAGRFRIATAGGAAQVSATDDDPDVGLSADTLGSLYLGGVQVSTLHRAGRLRGSGDAIDTFAAMADAGPAPYCLTHF
jgi:predicted acetyltransferase